MNGLEKEITELKNFVGDLKNDRQEQKDKEQRESWTKYASLSIVFIAVRPPACRLRRSPTAAKLDRFTASFQIQGL